MDTRQDSWPASTPLNPEAEAFVARLTRTAYEVALTCGPSRPFAELELQLWHALREVVRDEVPELNDDAGDPDVWEIVRYRPSERYVRGA